MHLSLWKAGKGSQREASCITLAAVRGAPSPGNSTQTQKENSTSPASHTSTSYVLLNKHKQDRAVQYAATERVSNGLLGTGWRGLRRAHEVVLIEPEEEGSSHVLALLCTEWGYGFKQKTANTRILFPLSF